MPMHAIIPATIANARAHHPTQSRIVEDFQFPGPSSRTHSRAPSHAHSRTTSYGATANTTGTASTASAASSPRARGKRPEQGDESNVTFTVHNGLLANGYPSSESSADDLEPVLDVTWTYKSRSYLLVPVVTLLFLTLLFLLITFAWPPDDKEREHGQTYPHPLLWKPLLVGLLASFTVQTIRIPVWVVVSWLGANPSLTTFLSTTLHTILHELLRMSTLPLITRSPTSGFHSSYYLGLGWGIAETVWGIIQGYEQLALYADIMQAEEPTRWNNVLGLKMENGEGEDEDAEGRGMDSPRAVFLDAMSIDEEQVALMAEREDEAELERKVEVLERVRARRDLEEVIGIPFPSIPFPLHLLWRLDTLLLNLGLTLILSAFYFDPVPIYRHDPSHPSLSLVSLQPSTYPHGGPSRYLWLVWALVTMTHVGVSLVWKVVGRVGIGSVTWGGLIVALGSVFAGLGGWGGLV